MATFGIEIAFEGNRSMALRRLTRQEAVDLFEGEGMPITGLLGRVFEMVCINQYRSVDRRMTARIIPEKESGGDGPE